MRQYLLASLLLSVFMFVVGCAPTRAPTLQANLTHETWMRSVDSDPMRWTRGADRWFLSGVPNHTELANRQAPSGEAISTMMVRAPYFTHIESNGDFQVQLFGANGENSVYLYGPNKDVREVIVTVRGNTLCITQTKQAGSSMRRVIVRIGMNHLMQLTQLGRGCIEGIQLRSAGLRVISAGSGNIYLGGNMNVREVVNRGRGSINIFGANTQALAITTTNIGNVHISGDIGVKRIRHYGRNNISIIGASNRVGLDIYAEGSGKISINGAVNLCKVIAKNDTCVYINAVNSNSIYACAYDRARIGLAGYTDKLYVETFQNADFYGRYLCAKTALVRAHDASHINVTATQRIFASATQRGSVYFFGTPNVLTQFVSGNGVILPIWDTAMRMCPMQTVYVSSYKGEGRYASLPRKRIVRVDYKAEAL